MRRDCSFGSKLLVVGGWSLVVGLIVAWVLSWCGSYRGAVLLGRCPRKFPSTLTIATRRLAALVIAACSWCGSPGPQSAQVSKHRNLSQLDASLRSCLRPARGVGLPARSPRNRPRIPRALDASLRSCLRPGRTAPRSGPHHVLEAPSFPLTIDKVWI